MTLDATAVYEFGPFTVDGAQKVLFENGQPVAITPKALQMLLILLESHGQLVAKTELLARVWPDVYVEEAVLTQNIFLLRKLLREASDGIKYIETIPKRGYRFATPVRRVERRSASSRGASAETARSRQMLVVLPIENLTGHVDQDYLIDGFTEAVIAQLGRLNPQALGVIARTSAMAYKGSRKTIRVIAGELNIQYALEGSVRQSQQRLLITVKLIRASDQSQVFSKQYSQEQADALTLQDDVSQAIADEVRVALHATPQSAAMAAASTRPDAHDHYLRGRYYWGIRSPEAVGKAIDHFQAACRIDPQYAAAHSGLAVCWGFRSMYSGLPPAQTFPIAKAAAERALELDDRVSEAHSMLGIYRAMFAHDWSAAEQSLRRAIELDPNSSVAHHWYALFLGLLGRLDAALREAEIALQLDPLSPAIRMNYGMIHQFCGRDYLTIDIYEGILAQNPHHHVCRIMLGASLCKVGRFDEGIAHLQTAHEHSGRQLDGLAHLGLGYAVAGRPELARKLLEEIRTGAGPVSSYYVSRIYVALGELDTAFEYLERAYQERSILVMAITTDPWFIAVRHDARYLGFARRLKI